MCCCFLHPHLFCPCFIPIFLLSSIPQAFCIKVNTIGTVCICSLSLVFILYSLCSKAQLQNRPNFAGVLCSDGNDNILLPVSYTYLFLILLNQDLAYWAPKRVNLCCCMCKKSYSKSWQMTFSLRMSKIARYNCLLLFQLIYQLQTPTYSSGVPWIISSAFTKQRYKIYNSPDTFYINILMQKTHTNGSSAT